MLSFGSKKKGVKLIDFSWTLSVEKLVKMSNILSKDSKLLKALKLKFNRSIFELTLMTTYNL